MKRPFFSHCVWQLSVDADNRCSLLKHSLFSSSCSCCFFWLCSVSMSAIRLTSTQWLCRFFASFSLFSCNYSLKMLPFVTILPHFYYVFHKNFSSLIRLSRRVSLLYSNSIVPIKIHLTNSLRFTQMDKKQTENSHFFFHSNSLLNSRLAVSNWICRWINRWFNLWEKLNVSIIISIARAFKMHFALFFACNDAVSRHFSFRFIEMKFHVNRSLIRILYVFAHKLKIFSFPRFHKLV